MKLSFYIRPEYFTHDLHINFLTKVQSVDTLNYSRKIRILQDFTKRIREKFSSTKKEIRKPYIKYKVPVLQNKIKNSSRVVTCLFHFHLSVYNNFLYMRVRFLLLFGCERRFPHLRNIRIYRRRIILNVNTLFALKKFSI